jgi:hypothetical protein
MKLPSLVLIGVILLGCKACTKKRSDTVTTNYIKEEYLNKWYNNYTLNDQWIFKNETGKTDTFVVSAKERNTNYKHTESHATVYAEEAITTLWSVTRKTAWGHINFMAQFYLTVQWYDFSVGLYEFQVKALDNGESLFYNPSGRVLAKKIDTTMNGIEYKDVYVFSRDTLLYGQETTKLYFQSQKGVILTVSKTGAFSERLK